jgi:hypothetical protein
MSVGFILALIFELSVAAPQLAPGTTERVKFCELVENEAKFANTIIETRAQLVRLANGEWAIDSYCIEPILLVSPEDVTPRSEIRLASSAGVQMLRKVQRERGIFFEADFVGRFDWNGRTEPVGQKGTIATYGRSRMSRRLVLMDVLNPERIVVPKR